MSQPVLMPKTKLPLEQAEKKDLEYWATRKENEVAERTSKYPDRDASDAVAIIERRSVATSEPRQGAFSFDADGAAP